MKLDGRYLTENSRLPKTQTGQNTEKSTQRNRIDKHNSLKKKKGKDNQ